MRKQDQRQTTKVNSLVLRMLGRCCTSVTFVISKIFCLFNFVINALFLNKFPNAPHNPSASQTSIRNNILDKLVIYVLVCYEIII